MLISQSSCLRLPSVEITGTRMCSCQDALNRGLPPLTGTVTVVRAEGATDQVHWSLFPFSVELCLPVACLSVYLSIQSTIYLMRQGLM